MQVFRSGAVSLWLLLVLGLVGCGDSRGDFAPSLSSSTEPVGPTAGIELRSVLAQTVIPSEVVTLRATGYDQRQIQRYGPVTQEKASVVKWSQVPVEVTDFVIEYLDGNGQIRGLAQVQVQLSPGQMLLIENLNILGITSSLEQLSIAPASRGIALGTSTQFTAVGTFADGSTHDLTSAVTWSAGESSVAAVNQGRAQGLVVGTTSITATFAGVSAQASLTVTSAILEALKLSPLSPAIAQGTSQAFTVEGFFSDGSFQDVTSDVEWASSNTQVAGLENGTALALQAGQTTITATLGGVSDQTVLTVTSATLSGLSLQGGAPSIALGTSTQFSLLGTFSDGSTQDLTSAATWEVFPAERAGVVQGRVTGLSSGSATVKATFAGLSDQANLEVGSAVVTSVQVETVNQDGSTLVFTGQTLNLRALATFSDGLAQEVTGDAVWTSDHHDIGTVSAGVVSGELPGQAFITASFGGHSGRLQVTVQEAPLPDLELSGAYTFDTDSGELSPQIGDHSTPPGWNSTEERLVLRSFTLQDGASLTLIGSKTFKVKTESSLLIAGDLNFFGQAGADGLDGAAGGGGTNGGDINLFSSGDLTVTGTVRSVGGPGGDGGGYVITGENRSNRVGGTGGRGGDSGEIILTAGDRLDLDSGLVAMQGGVGGAGGKVEIGGSNTSPGRDENDDLIIITVTGGAGGKGGDGRSHGGAGGTGGEVTIFGENNPLTFVLGGAGGDGGHGRSQDGAGGTGGAVTIHKSNASPAIGGAGGNGGNGTSLAETGGKGGDGGSVVILELNTAGATAIGGAGGRGGDGGTQGGAGGDGGDVSIGGTNSSATGGAGGRGGDGGVQGGAGGDGGDVTIDGLNWSATGGAGGRGGGRRNSRRGRGRRGRCHL